MQIETHKTAVFGTAHIPMTDSRLLNQAVREGETRAGKMIVDDYPYGWRVFLGTAPVWENFEDLSDAAQNCLRLAHAEGCLWVEFDRDGPEYDLETFDW